MNEQEVRDALIEWETLSANKENKVLYEARLKYLRDQLTNLVGERKAGREEGLKQGIEQGLKKGEIQATRKLAFEMLKKGLSIETIEEITKLGKNEIEELMQEGL